jgi:small conductance mechanosensitive channel
MPDVSQDVTQSVTHWKDIAITFAATYGLSLAGGIIILIVGWKGAGWAHRIVDSVLKRTHKVDPTVRHFLASLVRYVILGFTILAVLDRFGIQTASIIAMLGAAGLAIGLALQGTLTNIAAGLMLMLFRPFKVGDHVDVGGQSGTVRGIDLFVTELVTDENVQILMPNTNVWGQSIVNRSHYATRRFDLALPVPSTEVTRAIEMAEKAVAGESKVLKDPKPEIITAEMTGKSVTVVVRVWCNREDFATVRADLIRNLRSALDAAGL